MLVFTITANNFKETEKVVIILKADNETDALKKAQNLTKRAYYTVIKIGGAI